MAAPNFADKTVWTGDNIDILRRNENLGAILSP